MAVKIKNQRITAKVHAITDRFLSLSFLCFTSDIDNLKHRL